MALRDFVLAHLSSLPRLVGRWKASRRGNIAMLMALLMAPIVGMMGLALDYGHLILMKSKLDQAALSAANAAANGARNVIQSTTRNAGDDRDESNSALQTRALDDGKKIGENIFRAQFGSSEPTVTVAVQRVSNTFNAKVEYSSRIDTYFAKYFNVYFFNIRGQQSIIIGMTDIPAKPTTPGSAATPVSVIDEKWVGSAEQRPTPTKPIINDWYSGTTGPRSPIVTDYNILKNNDRGDPIVPTAIRVGEPQGIVAPIISKKVYLPAGDYELRYWYKSTVVYPEYEPIYICGSIGNEIRWASSTIWRNPGSNTNQSSAVGQSARAGVYLDPILTNPQLATTPPTLESFSVPPSPPSSANVQVDICVYSSRWIQRSIRLKILASGYFWLSFVAEVPDSLSVLRTAATGQNLANVPNTILRNGFYLGPVQLCASACSGDPNVNSPWAAYGPSNPLLLFKDTFNSPVAATGSAFNLNSGTIPAAAGYVMPPQSWIVANYKNYGSIANSWVYSNNVSVLGSNGMRQHVQATLGEVQLSRQLILLPGYYRLSYLVADASWGANNTCVTGTTGNVNIGIFRSGPNVDSAGGAQPDPPGLRNPHKITSVELFSCSTFTVPQVMCVLIGTAHPYEFAVSTMLANNVPLVGGGARIASFSVELLSTDMKKSFSDMDIPNNCMTRTGGNAFGWVPTESTYTITGARMWPGFHHLPPPLPDPRNPNGPETRWPGDSTLKWPADTRVVVIAPYP